MWTVPVILSIVVFLGLRQWVNFFWTNNLIMNNYEDMVYSFAFWMVFLGVDVLLIWTMLGNRI